MWQSIEETSSAAGEEEIGEGRPDLGGSTAIQFLLEARIILDHRSNAGKRGDAGGSLEIGVEGNAAGDHLLIRENRHPRIHRFRTPADSCEPVASNQFEPGLSHGIPGDGFRQFKKNRSIGLAGPPQKLENPIEHFLVPTWFIATNGCLDRGLRREDQQIPAIDPFRKLHERERLGNGIR